MAEADRQLEVVPGRAHRRGDRDAVEVDRERLLDDELVGRPAEPRWIRRPTGARGPARCGLWTCRHRRYRQERRRPTGEPPPGRFEGGHVRRGARIAIAAGFTAAACALAPPAQAQVPVLHLDGRGFGHGVGPRPVGRPLRRRGRRRLRRRSSPPSTRAPRSGRPAAPFGWRCTPVPTPSLAFPQGGELRSPLVGDQAARLPRRRRARRPGSRRPADGGFAVEAVLVAQSTAAPVATSGSTGRRAGLPPAARPLPGRRGNGGGGECALGCVPTTTAPVPPVEPAPTEPPTDRGAARRAAATRGGPPAPATGVGVGAVRCAPCPPATASPT